MLPTLTNVKTLWFQSRTSQEMFEAACAVPNLEGLYIKWGALTDMTPVTQAQGLKALHIGGSPSMQHLEALTGLPKLQWLELENIKALADPAFVGQLTRLRGRADGRRRAGMRSVRRRRNYVVKRGSLGASQPRE